MICNVPRDCLLLQIPVTVVLLVRVLVVHHEACVWHLPRVPPPDHMMLVGIASTIPLSRVFLGGNDQDVVSVLHVLRTSPLDYTIS